MIDRSSAKSSTPGQTRRRYGAIVLDSFYRKILHQIMAHIRLYDCVCLLAGSLLLFLMRLLISAAVDFVGRYNLLYLRSAIARERASGPIARGCHSRESGRQMSSARMGRVICVARNNKPPYLRWRIVWCAPVFLWSDTPNWRFSFTVLHAFCSSDLDVGWPTASRVVSAAPRHSISDMRTWGFQAHKDSHLQR